MSDGYYQNPMEDEYITGLISDMEKFHELGYNLTELIKGNFVHFQYFREGYFYYNLIAGDKVYQFPVPLSDVAGASLQAMDKAIMYMRWIRRAISDKTFIKI